MNWIKRLFRIKEKSVFQTKYKTKSLPPNINSKTARLDIGNKKTIYPTAGYNERGEMIYIDIKIGHQNHGSEKFDCESLQQLRALIEIVCELTNALLKFDWKKADLMNNWRGSKCEPCGYCPQLKTFVSSPLDAVARWLSGEKGQ
jgi:hypothetical protein